MNTGKWIPCFNMSRPPRYGVNASDVPAAALAALGALLSGLSRTLGEPPATPVLPENTEASFYVENVEVLRTEIFGFDVHLWWRWEGGSR